MDEPLDGMVSATALSDGIAKLATCVLSAFPATSLASSVMSIRPESIAASKALMQGNRVSAGGWTVSDAP